MEGENMNEISNSDLIEMYKLVDDYIKILTKEKESFHDGE